MSPGTPDGHFISYSYKYGTKRSPVSPVEIEEDEEAGEGGEEGEEYVARSSERRTEMAYANALTTVSSGAEKPPSYGTVTADNQTEKTHEWIEPRNAIKKQQKRAVQLTSDEEDFKAKDTRPSRAILSSATAPSYGRFEYEAPKVNIPNLPESVLDEVYQAAGLLVSYSDIRDVKEMPEK